MKTPTNKAHDATWFVREVQKQLKKNPTRPVRLNITKAEVSACDTVFDNPVLGKNDEKPMLTGCISEHADPILRADGRWRAAFFGPDCQRPAPVEKVPLRLRGKDRHSRRIEANTKRDALQRKHGPDFHVELVPLPWQNAPHGRCEIWRGEDWLAKAHAAFYPAEIARYLSANISQVRILKMLPSIHGRKSRGRPKEQRTFAAVCEDKRGRWSELIAKGTKPNEAADIIRRETKSKKKPKSFIDQMTNYYRKHPAALRS